MSIGSEWQLRRWRLPYPGIGSHGAVWHRVGLIAKFKGNARVSPMPVVDAVNATSNLPHRHLKQAVVKGRGKEEGEGGGK